MVDKTGLPEDPDRIDFKSVSREALEKLEANPDASLAPDAEFSDKDWGDGGDQPQEPTAGEEETDQGEQTEPSGPEKPDEGSEDRDEPKSEEPTEEQSSTEEQKPEPEEEPSSEEEPTDEGPTEQKPSEDDVPPVWEVPDDYEYDIPVENGEVKTFKGKAIRAMVNQARNMQKIKQEFEQEKESFESERDTHLQTARQEALQGTARQLMEMGLLIPDPSTPQGAAWNPKVLEVLSGEASAPSGERQQSDEPDLPSIPEDELKELADDYPAVAQAMKGLTTYIGTLKERLRTVETGVASTREQTEAQRQQEFHQTLDSAIQSHPIFKRSEALAAQAKDQMIALYADGHREDPKQLASRMGSTLAKELGIELEPTGESDTPSGSTSSEPPKAETPQRRSALTPPPRPGKSSAPPAVGSGGRTGSKKPAEKKAEHQSELGTRESKAELAEALQKWAT